jgi:hypothetical protein
MRIRFTGALIALLCGYACYWSARWALADFIIRFSIERALRLAPANPDYYLRWARAEPGSALPALERAVELDPMDSSVWIELAEADEKHGDVLRAEHDLLRAADLDRTFAPRWLLAQFYSRRRDETHFWRAVRAALDASYDDITPLFDMCWEIAPDPQVIQDRALPERPDVWRQYFDFLLTNHHLDAANAIANRIVHDAGPEALPSLLSFCDRLIEANQVPRAVEVWNLLVTKRLLDYRGLAPRQGLSLTNGSFAKPILARAFDWRVSAPPEVAYRQETLPSGLRFEFFGNQPEHCELLTQFVPVEPDRQYRFVAKYDTEGLDADTGFALDLSSGRDLLLGGGALAPSQRRQTTHSYEFKTTSQTTLVKLELAYSRVLGTVRIEGSLSLDHTALDFDR